MLLYPATVIPDGDTYVVLFPDLPYTHTNGSSPEDALSHAPDALQLGISALMEQGATVPLPSKPTGLGAVLVALPSVLVSAKVELYMAMQTAGVRKAELARRMGIHKQQVERLMDIDHKSRIEQLEAAFACLRMRMVVEIQSAA